jgi:hypothetical protein
MDGDRFNSILPLCRNGALQEETMLMTKQSIIVER